MSEVRVVRRMTLEMLRGMGRLEDGVLVGEETMLRVGRSGFALSYLPLPKAVWRSFPPASGALPEQVLRADKGAVFGAWDGDRIIGLACIRMGSAGWAELVDIRVDASHRRCGIARMLLDACDRFAAEQGARGIRLEASEANPVLCQFCEHTGFVLHGLDRMALVYSEAERSKPMARRACALYFYRLCGV